MLTEANIDIEPGVNGEENDGPGMSYWGGQGILNVDTEPGVCGEEHIECLNGRGLLNVDIEPGVTGEEHIECRKERGTLYLKTWALGL